MRQHPEGEMTFADWLKSSRRALDLTQDDLAARVGYASPTLQKIERGVRRPSRELAERLAEVLAIPEQQRPHFLHLARGEQAETADQHAELDEPPPAIRPRPTRPLVALLGRDEERAGLVERLRDPRQRLITLVGPGGIGKTSLALHVAADLRADANFPDGVAVVLLAPVAAADDVPLAIVEALGLPIHGTQFAADQLIDALRDRALLLVLDNAEHLLGPGDGVTLTRLLGRILAEAPAVRLLVTSRERLRLRTERVVDLSGLAFPSTDTGSRVDRAAAVQLFVERAQQAAATFTLGAANRTAVARICRRLEGLPLAIELAASWIRALTPQEIAAEIDRSLDFLAGDQRDTAERHRSVRAALDHSWRLLDPTERDTLMRLSVFRGGCDREAASAVVGATLPILTALIDKSLLRATSASGITRYTLHELVRQYAAERLAADPAEEQATATRHAAYYADLLQHAIVAQTGVSAPQAMKALTHNIDNVRAAWIWAATHGDAATVMGMTRGISLLYDTNGWLLDAVTLFERAAEALHAESSDTLAAEGLVIGWQGYFLYRAGRLAEAAQQMDQGLALVQATGTMAGLADLLLHRGAVEVYSARFAEAQVHHAHATQVANQNGDDFVRYWVECFAGLIALFTGAFVEAEQHLAACLHVWRTQGFSRGTVAALVLLGETARVSGRPVEAEAYVRESLRISSATRDTPTIAACLRELGALALARGEFDEARYLLAEGYEGLRAVGDLMYAGRSRSLMIRLQAQCGEFTAARQGCAELLRLARTGLLLLLPEAAYGLALTLLAEGHGAEALAVVTALDGASGEYATLALAREMRVQLEGRFPPGQRVAGPVDPNDLLPWLEELCARSASPTPLQSRPSPVGDTPIVPIGALFIPETGATLSPREIDVLRLLIAGVGNQAIADTLVISLHTAKKHVASILEKFGVATRTQAALRGRALGLLPLPPR